MIAKEIDELEQRLAALDGERDRIRATLAVNGRLKGLNAYEILTVFEADETPNRFINYARQVAGAAEEFSLVMEKVAEFIDELAEHDGESETIWMCFDNEVDDFVRRVLSRAAL